MPLSLSLIDILMRSGSLIAVLMIIYAIIRWLTVCFTKRIQILNLQLSQSASQATRRAKTQCIKMREIVIIIADGCITLMKIIGAVALMTIVLMIGG